MHRSKHAEEITNRFRELVENSSDTLNVAHYEELSLLIEAGLDAALLEHMERTATSLEKMAHEIRHSAEFFDDE